MLSRKSGETYWAILERKPSLEDKSNVLRVAEEMAFIIKRVQTCFSGRASRGLRCAVS